MKDTRASRARLDCFAPFWAKNAYVYTTQNRIQSDPISMRALAGKDRVRFRRALLRWYDANRRDLPWRRTHDPYKIWISEVMLQQTRVAVVIERYKAFLKRFPSVRALSMARETAVLAEWSGLGYYRRARNLHAAARLIVRERRGEFPASAVDLRTLPGVGRYTAAAIASIAFGEPVAVVDGNVERVLSRVTAQALAGERMWFAAQELLDAQRPGDFNQAMMELGATVCLPAQPICVQCPVRKFCRTRGIVRNGARKPRQMRREIAYLLATRGDAVLLVRRPASKRLMPGMWELPELGVTGAERNQILFSLAHSITVTNYQVRVVGVDECETIGSPRSQRERWVRTNRLCEVPLTGLARKILRRAGVI